MVDSIESSVFEALIGLLASPIAQKIGDVLDLREELQALARAQDDAVDGGLRVQRRLVAYEAEDLLHNLMIVAATFMDSGEEEEEERYELGFDGDSL